MEETGFVPAYALEKGDLLRLSDGSNVPVEDVEIQHLDEPVKVYNFTVEDNHTYYVGDSGVWVHNAKCGKKVVKSEHAEVRSSQGRNVNTVINDLNQSTPSKIYLQDDGRYVIKGANGRVHILESNGEIVTTMNKVTNLKKRVSSGRYRSLTQSELKEFAKKFTSYLNKSWLSYND